MSADSLCLDDTGSDVLTPYESDLAVLGVRPDYDGWAGLATFSTANGDVERKLIKMEIRLRMANEDFMGQWSTEICCVYLSFFRGFRIWVCVNSQSTQWLGEPLHCGQKDGNNQPARHVISLEMPCSTTIHVKGKPESIACC